MTGDTVWVVQLSTPDEVLSILGVFSTQQAAIAAAQAGLNSEPHGCTMDILRAALNDAAEPELVGIVWPDRIFKEPKSFDRVVFR